MLGKDEESVSDQMNDVLAQVSDLKFKVIYPLHVVLFIIIFYITRRGWSCPLLHKSKTKLHTLCLILYT